MKIKFKWQAFLFVLMVLIFLSDVYAQNYAEEMQKANEALKKKDYPNYLEHMKAASGIKDKVGRPYYLYGLARAYAFNGNDEDSYTVLRQILQEGIETPMVFLAETDHAFQKFRDDQKLKAVMTEARNLPIQMNLAAGSVYSIDGAGCTLAVRDGKDGLVLVDTGYPQRTKKVVQMLREKFPGKQIRYVINTHEHYDHAAGNDLFEDYPLVIAQDLALPAMKKPSEFFSDFSMPAFSAEQLPSAAFNRRLDLYLDSEQVTVLALTAHSEGDSVVYFHQSRVLHMGDNFFPETTVRIYPGANAESYFETFGPFLNSLPEDATVLSGHAPAVKIQKLRDAYQATESIYRFVKQHASSTTLDEIQKLGAEKSYPADWIQFFHKQISNSAKTK